MKTIVVVTDFSERSDRAFRRAKLLACEFDAKLYLVHVVDDDQVQLIMLAEEAVSPKLPRELTCTPGEIDAVKYDFRAVLGQPLIGITQSARDALAIPPLHNGRVS